MEKLPTWVEINLDNFLFNIASLRRRIGENVKILLTIKADAYGHGAVQMADAAGEHVDMFGVATFDEAMELGGAGIDASRILILSPILDKEIPLILSSGFSVTVSNYSFARTLSERAADESKSVDIHIEVDTGMGRTGMLPGQAEEEIVRIASLAGLKINGLYTHFPSSDDAAFTRAQIREFLLLVESLKKKGLDIPLLHSANSEALTWIKESHLDMVRPGLILFGHLPNGDARGFPAKPVMSWKSRLVQIRELPAGRTISYGRTFTTRRKTLVGVVPVGYGHGYPYNLSNKGKMIVHGVRVPVLGRVTMDMTMVDLNGLGSEPHLGDEVVIFGEQGKERISLHELAGWAETIPYEILCRISKRVPRTFLRNGRVETYKSLLGVIADHVFY